MKYMSALPQNWLTGAIRAKNKWLFWVVLTGFVIFGLTGFLNCVLAQTAWWVDNFESYQLGNLGTQGGWVSTGANWQVINDISRTGSQSIKMPVGTYGLAEKRGEPVLSGDLTFWIRIEKNEYDENKPFYIGGYDEANAVNGWAISGADGKIFAINNIEYVELGNVPNLTWISVRLWWDKTGYWVYAFGQDYGKFEFWFGENYVAGMDKLYVGVSGVVSPDVPIWLDDFSGEPVCLFLDYDTCLATPYCDWNFDYQTCWVITPEIPSEFIYFELPELEECSGLGITDRLLCEIKNFFNRLFVPSPEKIHELRITLDIIKAKFPYNYILAFKDFFVYLKNNINEEQAINFSILGQAGTINLDFWNTTTTLAGSSQSFLTIFKTFFKFLIILIFGFWCFSFIKRVFK